MKFLFTALLVITALDATVAEPATNVVTLAWRAPVQMVPTVYEVQQTLSLVNPVWTVIAANIPATTTNLTLTIDRDLKFWRVRTLNATNSAWASDFSNVAHTLWPNPSDSLSIRLGP